VLLRRGAAQRRDFPGVEIRDPVLIEDGVTIERSVIGPNVTIERDSTIADSELAHTIVGQGCRLSGVRLNQSMLGNHVTLRDFRGTASLGDHSELVGSA
jgi:NDP-sugar pyrophosphorylase family protein